MNKIISIFFSLVISIFGAAQTLEEQFQKILDSVYHANQDAVGILVHVESPNHNISWTSAVGYSNKETKEELHKDQPALIASNTKTYVAVSILRLVEEGLLELDESVDSLIDSKTRELLLNDGYQLDEITVRHLLSHTSGIADYVDEAYFKFVNEVPDYEWVRDKQIELATKVGSPLAKAGKQFNYGDINYLLLTEVIEGKTKKPFYISIRELINYQNHHLSATWFINLEEQPSNSFPLVHQYWEKYKWDSYDLNPSWDLYGGGGLASTVKEISLFFQFLFEGEIIKDEELLKQLYTYVLPQETSNYCLGLRNISFHGKEGYYHGGFWGTDVMYLPEINTSVAIFTLQKEKRDLNALINYRVVEILSKN